MNPFIQAGLSAGLPPALASYMPRYIQIESGGDPNQVTGSYSGLLQMGPDEMRRFGGNGLDAGAKMYSANYKQFKNKFGRDPSPTELYMVAQQGFGGASAQLSNPNQPAYLNTASTAEGRRKGVGWAKKAIWGNMTPKMKAMYPGGVETVPGSAFLDMWKARVNSGPGATPSPTQPSTGTPMPQQSQTPGFLANLFGGQGTQGGFIGRGIGNPNWSLGAGLQGLGAGLIAAGGHPSALSILPALAAKNQRKPQWMPTTLGYDRFGKAKKGFIDMSSGTVIDGAGRVVRGPGSAGGAGSAPGGGAPMAASSYDVTGQAEAPAAPGTDTTDQASDPYTAVAESSLHGKDLLNSDLWKKVPAQDRTAALGIVQGTKEIRPEYLTRNKYGRQLNTLINAIEPGVNITARAAGAKDWGGGKSQEITRRANTGVQHFHELDKAFAGEGNSNWGPIVNAPYNVGRTLLGYSEASRVSQVVNQAANEISAFYRQGNQSDQSVREWAAGFPVNGSPQQQKVAMRQGLKMYIEALEALKKKRLAELGPLQAERMGPLESPGASKAIKALAMKYGVDPNTGDDLEQQYQEGQTATNKKTGQQMIFKDGQWQTK